VRENAHAWLVFGFKTLFSNHDTKKRYLMLAAIGKSLRERGGMEGVTGGGVRRVIVGRKVGEHTRLMMSSWLERCVLH
jgi:hypothetical protein